MADSTWTGAIDSDWNTAGNWTAGVPGVGDTATFNGFITVNGALTNVASIAVTGGGVTLTGAFATSGVNLSVVAGAYLALAGSVSGAGALTKSGPGEVQLSGANTYTGGTTALAGTLNLFDVNGLGVGTVVVNGAQLALGSLAITNAITYQSGTVTFADAYAGTLTISGATLTVGVNIVSDFGGTIAVPAGATFNFNSDALAAATVQPLGGTLLNGGSFAGTALITSGTFTATALPSASFAVDGGTLNLGGGAITRPVNIQEGTLTNGSIAVQYLGFSPIPVGVVQLDVALTGTAVMSVAGSVSLSQPSSWDGEMTLANGSFTILAGANIGGGNHTSRIYLTAGNLRVNGTQTLSGIIAGSSGTRVIVGAPVGDVIISNPANTNVTVDVVGAGNGFRATVAGAVYRATLHDGLIDLNGLDANGITSYGGSIENGQNYTGGTVLVVGPDAGSSGVTTLVPGPAFGPALSGGTAVIGTGVGGTLEIPIGASVTGLVDNGGVLGPGGGVVVVADDGTPRTPMGAYGGRCGSTYAVRQF